MCSSKYKEKKKICRGEYIFGNKSQELKGNIFCKLSNKQGRECLIKWHTYYESTNRERIRFLA